MFAVTGKGYSLLWREDDRIHANRLGARLRLLPARRDVPPALQRRALPSRYLALQIGTVRYPMMQHKRDVWSPNGIFAVKVEDGGMQLEYEDQDPRIHEIWFGGDDEGGHRAANEGVQGQNLVFWIERLIPGVGRQAL